MLFVLVAFILFCGAVAGYYLSIGVLLFISSISCLSIVVLLKQPPVPAGIGILMATALVANLLMWIVAIVVRPPGHINIFTSGQFEHVIQTLKELLLR